MPMFMPFNAIIHYKTAFDVTSEDTNLMFLLRKVIKNWASHHDTVTSYGKCYLNDDWFFKGDNEQHQIGIAYIRTASNIGKYSNVNPEHWVFELVHRDRKNQQRLWSTSIGLSQINSQEVRFACVLKHAISENFIGTLEDPIPSVPRFVKSIVSNYKFICKKSHINLNLLPLDINESNINDFIHNIIYEERYLPFVCIAQDEEGKYPINAVSLHTKNIANANIYTIGYKYLSQFNEGMPYPLRCEPGMVRIYKNYVPNDSGSRHRFYLKEKCLEFGEKIEDIITYALSRNANNFKPSEVVEINHVISMRKFYQLETLKNNKNNNGEDTALLLELYEDQLEQIKVEKEDAEKLYEACDQENERLREELREIQWKSEQYPNLQKENAFLTTAIDKMRDKFSLPNNLEECLNLILKFYPDRIVVHDEAFKSANRFYLKDNKEIIYEAWDMLMAISNVLSLEPSSTTIISTLSPPVKALLMLFSIYSLEL